MTQDTLIRNARIVDGTGAPWFRGDVRLAGGRIAAVGPALEAAAGGAVVEAEGRWLAPGFIDAHCHDDLVFLREPDRPEKLAQGVTTIVAGNCSFSLYPAPPAARADVRDHFSGLLGPTADHEVFTDFAAYRAALHEAGIGPNLVSLVGHGPIRLAVLGHARRAATPAEITAMQALLTEQLRAGAAGLSFGLVYPPSAFAAEAELVALAATAAANGKLVAAHVRSYERGLAASIGEFLAVLGAAKAPGLLSHLQAAGHPNWGAIPAAIAQLQTARENGIDVSFDMYPYTAGSSYILQLLPPSALGGGMPALHARLADPSTREALRRWVEEGAGDEDGQSKVSLIGWNNVQVAAVGIPSLKSCEGRRMTAAAEALGTTPFELMLRFIAEEDGRTGIVMFQLGEEDVRCACTHALHMAGSDGLPRPGAGGHPRAFGTFPRMAGRLRRDAGWFTIEDAVRRMTSIAAQRFGLFDRGLVRPGMTADLVLFDDGLADAASFEAPSRPATGVRDVWVAGEAVWRNGGPTGRRPGRVL